MAADAGQPAQEDRGQSGPWAAELRRNFPLHVVFHSAALMLILVNKAELNFARSLVVCDAAVDPLGNFTGSATCGDRLVVIDRGQQLSSTGQGQECFFKVLAMVFIAVFADVVGRKPALVVGLLATAASAALFIVATMSPPWLAFRLFAAGQGLQGAYPAELLGSIVASDISNERGGDVLAVSGLSAFLAFCCVFLGECASVALNTSGVTNFRPIWTVVFLANTSLAVAAMRCCRETRPTFVDCESPKSVLAGVGAELREYGSLLFGNSLLRLNLAQYACISFAFCCMSIDLSWYMSHHGVSQDIAATRMCVMFPIGVLCFGLPGAVCQKFGMVRGFVGLLIAMNVVDALFLPWYPMSPGLFLAHHYLVAGFSGMKSVSEAVDARWFDQRLTAKFLSMRGLSLYVVGMFANPIYAASFDARATTYAGKMAPYGLRMAAQVAHACLCFGPIWRAEGGLPVVLARIQKEREQGAATSDDKPAAEKKAE